jgi:hypothetical protein
MVRFILTIATVILVAALAIADGRGRSEDTDWKFYGSLERNEFFKEVLKCFYDAGSVARQADGHIRVWTKCLSNPAIDKILKDEESETYREIWKRVFRIPADAYDPPMIKVEPKWATVREHIIIDEQTADVATIEPTTRIYYEINCADKQLRVLSTELHVNGKSEFENKSSDWAYIPPKTNVAYLLKILCPKMMQGSGARGICRPLS